MDDSQLVAAALAGDGNAVAAIYDRYADRIHDFCVSILRNRAEASSALQETFLVAFEVLAQLAEPARLRAWLYALAHRVVVERLADQGQSVDHDEDHGWGSNPVDERLSRAEMAEFVWQASAGLGVRDRTLLDLHLRQGLEGRDLASAGGVAPSQVDSRIARLEGQVERSLGALLVARTSRRSCPGLGVVLAGWDGRMSAPFGEQVTDHVDDCEVCNSRRRIAPSPLALLGATPLSPAPAYLRSVVLGKAELNALEREGGFSPGRLPESAGWSFARDGFPDLNDAGTAPGSGRSERPTEPGGGFGGAPGLGPGVGSRSPERTAGPVYASTRQTSPWAPAARVTAATGSVGATDPTRSFPRPGPRDLPAPEPEPEPDDHDRRGMLVGALAGVIILIAAGVIVASNRSPSRSGSLAATVTTTAATGTSPTVDTTPATTVASVATPTTVVATTVATSGHLVVAGAKSLNFGTSSSTATVTIGNDGQTALDFVATATGVGLTVTPISGILTPGASQALTIALDRTSSAPGTFTGSIQISAGSSNSTINVTALVDPGPSIVGEVASHDTVYSPKCKSAPPSAPSTSAVTATVTGTQPLQLVVLHWASTTISGATGTATMSALGSDYTATLGPYASGGLVDWWITAIDAANATSTSVHHTLNVC